MAYQPPPGEKVIKNSTYPSGAVVDANGNVDNAATGQLWASIGNTPLTPAQQKANAAKAAANHKKYTAHDLYAEAQINAEAKGQPFDAGNGAAYGGLASQEQGGNQPDKGLGILSWMTAIGDFFSALLNPFTWERIGLVLLGALMIMFGFYMLIHQNVSMPLPIPTP